MPGKLDHITWSLPNRFKWRQRQHASLKCMYPQKHIDTSSVYCSCTYKRETKSVIRICLVPFLQNVYLHYYLYPIGILELGQKGRRVWYHPYIFLSILTLCTRFITFLCLMTLAIISEIWKFWQEDMMHWFFMNDHSFNISVPKHHDRIFQQWILPSVQSIGL